MVGQTGSTAAASAGSLNECLSAIENHAAAPRVTERSVQCV
jgi:hypothetical protein